MAVSPSPPSGKSAVAILLLALATAALADPTLATGAAHAPRALVALGRFVTGFGTSGYMLTSSALVAATAVAALRRGRRAWQGRSLRLLAERALYIFAAVAVSGILAQVIKHLLGRARPALLAVGGAFSFHPLSTRDVLASFPSGHTTSAFAAAVALGCVKPAWRPALLGCAALIGASRVLIGAHFPSDVVGGAALGTGVSLALARDFARRGLAFAWRGDRAVMKPLRPANQHRDADG